MIDLLRETPFPTLFFTGFMVYLLGEAALEISGPDWGYFCAMGALPAAKIIADSLDLHGENRFYSLRE